MKVRVCQSFDSYRRGQEFDWPAPMVKILSARGLVEILSPEETRGGVETAQAAEQAVERAHAPTKARRRRK